MAETVAYHANVQSSQNVYQAMAHASAHSAGMVNFVTKNARITNLDRTANSIVVAQEILYVISGMVDAPAKRGGEETNVTLHAPTKSLALDAILIARATGARQSVVTT